MSIRKYATSTGSPRWSVEWRLPGNMKRRKAFRTEREARAFEAEVRTSQSRGIVVDPRRGSSITVEIAYKRWLASRADLSAKVKRGYEDCWRLAIYSHFGVWPLTRVDRFSVQAWVNGMADEVGPRTQRWRHSVLRMVLQYAVEHDWIVKNPCVSTTFPPLIQRDHVYLTAAEVDRLASMCGPQGDVVTLLAYTGLRWGELVGLRIADVDVAARRLYVRRSITQVGGKLVSGPTKSKAGMRTVPLPVKVLPLFVSRFAGRTSEEAAVTSPRGSLLSRENWVRAVRWNEQRVSMTV
jgi:integrase